jgi:hypothetical protein
MIWNAIAKRLSDTIVDPNTITQNTIFGSKYMYIKTTVWLTRGLGLPDRQDSLQRNQEDDDGGQGRGGGEKGFHLPFAPCLDWTRWRGRGQKRRGEKKRKSCGVLP